MTGILESIKALLGIETSVTHFDNELIILINSAFMTMMQIGVGPTDGFVIVGTDEVWTDFLGDRKDLEMVKNFIFLKVKIIFDPPTNSAVLDAYERVLKEYEWRLLTIVDPVPVEEVVEDDA